MKKSLKITLIVLGVLLGIILIDTIQAKIFDNSPLLKIRDNLDGGSTDYIDKGLFVNHYHCNNNEKVTTWKGEKFACSEKENIKENVDLSCLESQLGGYIISEKIEAKEEKLSNLIEYDINNVEYSNIRKSDIGIYVILKTDDDKIIKELDNYFGEKYIGYKSIIKDDYKIYVYNNANDFDLEKDLAKCD